MKQAIRELEFVRKENGWDFYQFKFTWVFRKQAGPFIVPAMSEFVLTVASKDGMVASNLRDDAGLNVTTDAVPEAQFVAKWQKFYSILSGHEVPKPV